MDSTHLVGQYRHSKQSCISRLTDDVCLLETSRSSGLDKRSRQQWETNAMAKTSRARLREATSGRSSKETARFLGRTAFAGLHLATEKIWELAS
jgi:hypothetical protein